MPRYFFVLPDASRPVGGVNVALQFVETLRTAGYEAAPLYSRPDFKYEFYDTSCAAYYYPPLSSVPRKFAGREKNIKESLLRLIKPICDKINAILAPEGTTFSYSRKCGSRSTATFSRITSVSC